MKLFVQLLSGKTLELDVEASDTINSVKTKIAAQEEIPYYKQSLVHDLVDLEDYTMLSDYDIKDGDAINLVLLDSFPLQINFDIVEYMDMRKDDIILICNGKDTIANVKAKIQEETGIKIEWQCLVVEEDYEAALHDDRTLFEFMPFPPKLLVCCVDNDGDSELEEGNEGDEEGDEGDEGNEGDEGDEEGNEGDEIHEVSDNND